jgi:hypothetical protein
MEGEQAAAGTAPRLERRVRRDFPHPGSALGVLRLPSALCHCQRASTAPVITRANLL